MKKLALALSVGLLGTVVLLTTAVAHGDGGKSFRAKLTGYEEIIPASLNTMPTPPTFAGEAGAVSSTGSGRFTARITSKDPLVVEYRLRYSNLEGGATTQAHIHFGQKHTVGGVSVFLCGDASRDPDSLNDIPNACTPVNGDIEGTFTAAEVIGPTGQGIEPTRIDELIRAMRNGTTYVNVHTERWLGGEIRGQVDGGGDDD